MRIRNPLYYILSYRIFSSVSDQDPYHLAGSGSVSDDTDPNIGKTRFTELKLPRIRIRNHRKRIRGSGSVSK